MKKAFQIALISIVMTAVVVFGAFAGGQPGTNGQQTRKVTLWSQFADPNSQDSGSIAFYEALELTRAQFPDIEIEHVGSGGEAYKQKIPVSGAANELPDIFFWWGGGTALPFVEGGRIRALDDLVSDGTLDKIVPGTTSNFIFDGKLYGLPIYISTAQLYVNEELLANAGVSAPETWDDLVAAIAALEDEGVIPIALGAKDRWPAMFWSAILDIRMAGVDAMNDALSKEGPFNTPEFVAAAEKFEELIDMGAFGSNYLGTSYDDAVNLFLTGKAAMIFMGAWVNGQIEGENSLVAGKVAPIRFPSIPGGNGNINDWHGGSGETFYINSDVEDIDTVWAVYKFFVEAMSKAAFLAGSGSSAWLGDAGDVSDMNPLAVEIGALSSTATGFSYWWDQILTGNDTESMFASLMKFLAGNSTPQQYTMELQTRISDTQ